MYQNLIDEFKKSVENFYRSKDLDADFVEFMKKNEKDAFGLFRKTQGLINELRDRVNKVNRRLLENYCLKEKIKSKKLKIWTWRDTLESSEFFDTSVVDYFPDDERNINIALDSIIKLNGWTFRLFIRSNKNDKETLQKKLKEIGIEKEGEIIENGLKDYRFRLNKTFNFDASLDEVAEFIIELVSKL